MWAGTRRLLLLTTPSPVKAITSRLGTRAKLVLLGYPYASVAALLADCHSAAVDQLMVAAGGPAWDEPALGAAARSRARRRGRRDRRRSSAQVEEIVAGAADVAGAAEPAGARRRRRSPRRRARPAERARRRRLRDAAPGADRLPDLRRYVRAMKRRLDQVAADPERDRVRMREVHEIAGGRARRHPGGRRARSAG